MLCFIRLPPHHSLLIYVKDSYICFIGKVTGIRSPISSASNDLIIPVDPINPLTSFWPISLQQLNDIIARMKPARSPGDVIPWFKKVFDTWFKYCLF